MYLFKLHSMIRATAEGKPEEARRLAAEAGFDSRIVDMIARSTDWRADPAGFRSSCELIADRGFPAFWRSVAYEHLGASSDQAGVRIGCFNYALAAAKGLPDSRDRTYLEMNASAGMLDTDGGTSQWSLDEVVMWMVSAGAYNAPGRAEVLARRMIAAGKRGAAVTLYHSLEHRLVERADTHFSPSQMARFTATIEAGG